MINTSGILYGSITAPAFALTAQTDGFPFAWLALIVVSLIPLPFLLLAREPARQVGRS